MTIFSHAEVLFWLHTILLASECPTETSVALGCTDSVSNQPHKGCSVNCLAGTHPAESMASPIPLPGIATRLLYNCTDLFTRSGVISVVYSDTSMYSSSFALCYMSYMYWITFCEATVLDDTASMEMAIYSAALSVEMGLRWKLSITDRHEDEELELPNMENIKQEVINGKFDSIHRNLGR